MPIDDAVGEVVGAAVEFMGDVILDTTEPKKRNRFRRFLYWSVMILVVGFLLSVVYLVLR